MTFSYWKRCVAEAIGTFGFFFIGFSGIALSVTQPTQIGSVAVAIGFGLGLALMIFAFGHISGGHFNPAVTVALVVGRQFPIREVAGYWIAQLVGGAVAAATVIATFGDVVSNHLVTEPGPGTTNLVALVLEAIATALFVIVISAVATDRAPWSGTLAPVAIGGFIAFRVVSLRRNPEPRPPLNLAPGLPDDVLEGRKLERVLGWALLFTLVLAVSVPVYFLVEPTREADANTQFLKQIDLSG